MIKIKWKHIMQFLKGSDLLFFYFKHWSRKMGRRKKSLKEIKLGINEGQANNNQLNYNTL